MIPQEADQTHIEYGFPVSQRSAERTASQAKRTTYREDEKMKIAKYANIYGTVSALRYFKQDFPKLTESTIRPWLAKYRSQLKTTSSEDSECIQISETRGRPLLLPNELERKLRTFITGSPVPGLQEGQSTSM